MKFSTIILIILLYHRLPAQEIIKYEQLNSKEVNCDELKSKSDSSFCMWLQSEEELNTLKRVYNYCPDSLKNYTTNNCPYFNFDTLINCIQQEVKIIVKNKLNELKSDEETSILYYEMLSNYYFIRRKSLDDYINYKCEK